MAKDREDQFGRTFCGKCGGLKILRISEPHCPCKCGLSVPMPRAVKWEVWAHPELPMLRHHIEERMQRDGTPLYAVCDGSGGVLAKDGGWEYEPIPSSRDEEFIARCRFASFNEALTAYRGITTVLSDLPHASEKGEG